MALLRYFVKKMDHEASMPSNDLILPAAVKSLSKTELEKVNDHVRKTLEDGKSGGCVVWLPRPTPTDRLISSGGSGQPD